MSETNQALLAYIAEIQKGLIKDVLDIGTRRTNPTTSTHQKALYAYPVHYVMTDFEPGLDVDVVSDAMALTKTFHNESFDAIYSASTFEHIQKPWLAADEIFKVLRPGGVFCIHSHFAFAEHGCPSDYFRYTQQGFRSLFDWATDVVTNYNYSCNIFSDVYPQGQGGVCYHNVNIFGRKPLSLL